MMREIKFRGYVVEEMEGCNQWVEGFGFMFSEFSDEYAKEFGRNGDYILYTHHGFYEVHGSSIGQYIGLKDKNGIGIYEGDIVDFTFFDHYDNGTNYKGVVKYRSGIYEIWKNNDSEFFGSDGPFILNFAWLQTEEFEVIGNIFENPELLEEKTHD